jgi:integrase
MASIRKRGDTFTITAYFGYDEQNRQIKKTTTYHPPDGVTPGKAEKLAKQYAVTWEDNIRGYVNLDENRTFSDLVKWYYDSIAPTVLKENVLYGKKRIIDMYVLPTLGREKIKNITPSMIDNLFKSLAVNGKTSDLYKFIDTGIVKNGKKRELARQTGLSKASIFRICNGGNAEYKTAEIIASCLGKPFNSVFISSIEDRSLQPNTLANIKRCLSSVFSTAVRKEIIRRNPCKNSEAIMVSNAAKSFLDEQQALTLLNALENHKDFQFRVMITLLMFTGMRIGELCGLTWENLDLTNGTIFICKALVYNLNNKALGKEMYSLQSPKTKSSERYIKIPPYVIELLKEHKEQQEKKRKQLAEIWVERGTVFTNTRGDYYCGRYLNRKFKAIAIKACDCPKSIHIHSLRHSAISMLINSDIPAKLIAEQAGHASVKITEDIYAHVFASSKVKTMQALTSKLLPSNAL